jgi:hypothetical protein
MLMVAEAQPIVIQLINSPKYFTLMEMGLMIPGM